MESGSRVGEGRSDGRGERVGGERLDGQRRRGHAEGLEVHAPEALHAQSGRPSCLGLVARRRESHKP